MPSPNNKSELHVSPTSKLLFVPMLIPFLINKIHAFSSLVFLQRHPSVIFPHSWQEILPPTSPGIKNKSILPLGNPLRLFFLSYQLGFPGGAGGKNLPASAGDVRDMSLIPGLGRSSGERHDIPLQCSHRESPVDRGAWQATVHRSQSDMTAAPSTAKQHASYPLPSALCTRWINVPSSCLWLLLSDALDFILPLSFRDLEPSIIPFSSDLLILTQSLFP